MKLYKIDGFLKKEKKPSVIWAFASSEESVLSQVGKFADEIKILEVKEAVDGWKTYAES